MRYTSISSKRQLTLSKSDLDYLKLKPGQKVTIDYQKGGLFIRAKTNSLTDEIGGALRDIIPESKYARPIEELMQETRRKLPR